MAALLVAFIIAALIEPSAAARCRGDCIQRSTESGFELERRHEQPHDRALPRRRRQLKNSEGDLIFFVVSTPLGGHQQGLLWLPRHRECRRLSTPNGRPRAYAMHCCCSSAAAVQRWPRPSFRQGSQILAWGPATAVLASRAIIRVTPPVLLPATCSVPLQIGDWGKHGNSNQRDTAKTMDAVAASGAKPAFIISTGDNFYRCGWLCGCSCMGYNGQMPCMACPYLHRPQQECCRKAQTLSQLQVMLCFISPLQAIPCCVL